MKFNRQRQTVRLFDGPITKILPHPNKNHILVAASNGNIICFEISPLRQKFSFKIFHQFLTSAALFGEGLLLGSSTGEFVHTKFNGEVLTKKKISDDCISSILVCETYVVTTGFDGTVNFLNKGDFSVEKCVKLNTPIWNSIEFENNIYVSGNPSYEINCLTYEPKKIKRFDSFAIFKGKLYGSSDERGLTCLKNNSNSYIPCNFILGLEKKMIIFSQECATEIIHEQQMEWKCHWIKEIRKGSTITCGVEIGDKLVIGDNSGNLYSIAYVIEETDRN